MQCLNAADSIFFLKISPAEQKHEKEYDLGALGTKKDQNFSPSPHSATFTGQRPYTCHRLLLHDTRNQMDLGRIDFSQVKAPSLNRNAFWYTISSVSFNGFKVKIVRFLPIFSNFKTVRVITG